MNGRCHRLGRLIIHDRHQRPRIELSCDEQGEPCIRIFNKDGKLIEELRFPED